jgi:hypothetical protein
MWVYTKAGEDKWKTERLPEYRDDTHDEGKELQEYDYKYCETWFRKGWVIKI